MIVDKRLKGVSDLIKNGQGFINPISEKANIFKNQCNSISPASLTTKARDIATKLNISNPDEFAADFANLQTKINGAVASIDGIKDHIDQLSGVAMDKEKNLIAAMDLVKAGQDIIKECSDNPDDPNSYQNNPVYKVFGSVLDSAKHNLKIGDSHAIIKEINDFFHIDQLSDYLHSLPENEKIVAIRAKINKLKDTYDTLKSIMDAAKKFDEDGYEAVKKEVMAQVATAALEAFVSDRCANQVMSKIQSPDLKKALKLAKQLKK